MWAEFFSSTASPVLNLQNTLYHTNAGEKIRNEKSELKRCTKSQVDSSDSETPAEVFKVGSLVI
jgi:hypothetical protein